MFSDVNKTMREVWMVVDVRIEDVCEMWIGAVSR